MPNPHQTKRPLTSEETPELVEAARNGDRKAQAELVKMYSGRIFNLGLRMLRTKQDAEDLLQETFITAFKKLDTFRGDSKFYTWLHRIAINIALGKLREQARMQISYSIQEPDFEYLTGKNISEWPDYLDTKISGPEIKRILKLALDELSEKYRSVFVLRDLEGLSTAETARALGLTESNVKVRLMRARLFLRDRIQNLMRREGWIV